MEAAGYVASARVLAGASFEMRYRITEAGSEAFRAYLQALHSILSAADAPRIKERL